MLLAVPCASFLKKKKKIMDALWKQAKCVLRSKKTVDWGKEGGRIQRKMRHCCYGFPLQVLLGRHR